MPKFKITTEDGTFVVEADSPETATEALNQQSQRNYMGKTDANGVPEGMIFDPATNRMVDARALAEKATPEGSLPGAWAKGIPFIGEYADEAVGWLASKNDPENNPNESQAIQTQVARESQKMAEENSPNAALAGKIVSGLSAAPAAVMNTPAFLTQGSLLARTALGAGSGLALGGAEGFVSGYGEGEGDKRLESAKDRAIWSGVTGAILGGAAPALTDAASAVAKKAKDFFTVNQQVKKLGMNRESADLAARALEADDTLGPAGLKRLTQAGDDAMLADAGDTSSGLLDTVIQKGGKGARVAKQAVEDRAAMSNDKLSKTLDMVLGKPPGINQAARDISTKSAAARKMAYDIAHSKPIDYATDAGRQVEDVFQRTPPSILRSAISEANDAMRIDRLANKQIMADIADDGTVTFRQMPNMMQVDYLKRALNEVADKNVDQFGRKTAAGARAARLAKELRDAAVEAVPEYKRAILLGGDKKAEDSALKLGAKLLKSSTTREEVMEEVDGITGPERKQLGLGLRQYIDDLTANVKKAVSNPNQDAREALVAFKEMSSKAAREKMTLAIGEDRVKPILKQLDETEIALGLKAATANNSKTFARQAVDEGVKRRAEDSAFKQLKQGQPWAATKVMLKKITGEDAASQLAQNDAIYEDIAKLLTGPRGPDAQLALQRLEKAYQTGQMNAQSARRIGEWIVGGADVTGYQFSTQAARK